MRDFRVPCGLVLSCWVAITLYACGEPLDWQPEIDLFPSCDIDADCADLEQCYEGRCLVPCYSDDECLDDERCGVPVGATNDNVRFCLKRD